MICLQACELDIVYNSYIDIEDYVWKSDKTLIFNIEIDDSSSIGFDVFYDLRYGIQYPYKNLFISYALKDSTGKIVDEGMQNLLLFEDKTGRPKGDGLGDIFDYEFNAFKQLDLSQKKYSLEINQYMREQDLPYIMSLGVKIKKSNPES